jgi:hypothetical protein
MMSTKLKGLIQNAEDHYLQAPELQDFEQQVSSLAQRLEAYEILRDFELEVFQNVADQLQSDFARLEADLFTRALEDGLAILRYSAMAMLQDNPQYLQRQLLAWLPSRAQAYELVDVEKRLLQLLQTQLGKCIPAAKLALIQPYLVQVHRSLGSLPSPPSPMVEPPAPSAELLTPTV